MKKSLLFGCLIAAFSVFGQTKLQSPDEFFPFNRGTEFTPHHQLVDYCRHLAEARPNQVKLLEMGQTWQHRPQMLVVIGSPDNMARLEELRLNNLRRTGFETGDAATNEVAFVWLGLSVHGNEPAGSEAAPLIMHDLLSNTACASWLKNAIVLVDVSQNPDGYSRYTHWNNNVSHNALNIGHDTREHDEPWPGGRVNHYYFDLNRDWAWQTQTESRNRIAMYHQWMPHVVADIHEQGKNAPYYFAPAAQPYHDLITPFQRNFQVTIGKNHASYFDRQGWLYFTKEVFDLLYPSYGDTYPTYHGAIGMTYEQGGIGAGKGHILENGDTLELIDRIEHHRTTALSTVEISAKNAADLVKNFTDYFHKSNNAPQGKYRTFVIPVEGQSRERIKALTDLLDLNHIRYGSASAGTTVTAYDYRHYSEKSVSVRKEDLIINTRQPASVLAQILLEPETHLVDSNTYDITAWSLPYAFGLQCFASAKSIEADKPFQVATRMRPEVAKPYAYLATWDALNNATFLGSILQEGVRVRFAKAEFEVDGKKWPAGTLVITRGENLDMGDDFDRIVREAAENHWQPLGTATTGMVDKGFDFGSSEVYQVVAPQIAVLYDDDTDNNSYGHVWYYLERDLNYPFTALHTAQVTPDALAGYNVIIVAERYGDLDSALMATLRAWTQKGGRLILLNEAIGGFEGQPGFAIAKYASDSDRQDAQKAQEAFQMQRRYAHFCDRERDALSRNIPGAIFSTQTDFSHPLAFGLTPYYTLRTGGGSTYAPVKGAWNVVRIEEKPQAFGFAGTNIKPRMSNSLVLADQQMGRGHVVYIADSPLFRCFWYQGKMMMANAIFFSGY